MLTDFIRNNKVIRFSESLPDTVVFDDFFLKLKVTQEKSP